MTDYRTGLGWDNHRLAPGRVLILAGVEIPHETGFEAHSDGDILLHAVTDALLGAVALGDIGIVPGSRTNSVAVSPVLRCSVSTPSSRSVPVSTICKSTSSVVMMSFAEA